MVCIKKSGSLFIGADVREALGRFHTLIAGSWAGPRLLAIRRSVSLSARLWSLVASVSPTLSVSARP